MSQAELATGKIHRSQTGEGNYCRAEEGNRVNRALAQTVRKQARRSDEKVNALASAESPAQVANLRACLAKRSAVWINQEQRSVRHQYWHRHASQNGARCSSKDRLSKATVPVSAHDNQICAFVGCARQNNIAVIKPARNLPTTCVRSASCLSPSSACASSFAPSSASPRPWFSCVPPSADSAL